MQSPDNRTNELIDHASAVGGATMSSTLPTLSEDEAFHRIQSEPVFQRRGSDLDTGVSSNGLSRTGSTTSTRSSSPTASLASQPLTLIDKIQVSF